MHPPPVPGFSNTLYQGRWYEVGTMTVHQYLYLLQHTLTGQLIRGRVGTVSQAFISTGGLSSTLYQGRLYRAGTFCFSYRMRRLR